MVMVFAHLMYLRSCNRCVRTHRYPGAAVQTGGGHLQGEGVRVPRRALSRQACGRRRPLCAAAAAAARPALDQSQVSGPPVLLSHSQRQEAGRVRGGNAGHATLSSGRLIWSLRSLDGDGDDGTVDACLVFCICSKCVQDDGNGNCVSESDSNPILLYPPIL